jgi:hypothetical protein
MEKVPNEILTLGEAAELLRIPPSTVYELAGLSKFQRRKSAAQALSLCDTMRHSSIGSPAKNHLDGKKLNSS